MLPHVRSAAPLAMRNDDPGLHTNMVVMPTLKTMVTNVVMMTIMMAMGCLSC